jgi:hypothetical protein
MTSLSTSIGRNPQEQKSSERTPNTAQATRHAALCFPNQQVNCLSVIQIVSLQYLVKYLSKICFLVLVYLLFLGSPPHPVRPRPLYLSLSPHNPPHPTLTVLNSRFDPTRPVASLRIKPTLSLSLALALALSLSLSRSLALALSLSRARALSSHIMYARPHKSHHHLMIPPPPLRVRPTGL